MKELPEHEGILAEIKEEATTHGQAVAFAVIRAAYVFIIEWVIHVLLHGLENHVMHERLPRYVYRIVEYAGILSLLLYVGARLWKHCLDTYVDTRLESRKALQRLAVAPRNNTQVENVKDSGHNEDNHENKP